jgi:tetratricopeptide (TPR) repeat protein
MSARRKALVIILICWTLFGAPGADAVTPESSSVNKVTAYPLVKEGYDEMQKGDYLEAVKTLCHAVIIDRDDVSARRYLALALIKTDDAARAIEQLGLVGRLTPPSSFDYFIYGEAYLALGKFKDAEDSYRKSLEKDSDYDPARAGLIKSLAGESDWDRALNQCQKYVKQAKTKEQKSYFEELAKRLKDAKDQAQAPVNQDDNQPGLESQPNANPITQADSGATLPPAATPALSPPPANGAAAAGQVAPASQTVSPKTSSAKLSTGTRPTTAPKSPTSETNPSP